MHYFQIVGLGLYEQALCQVGMRLIGATRLS